MDGQEVWQCQTDWTLAVLLHWMPRVGDAALPDSHSGYLYSKRGSPRHYEENNVSLFPLVFGYFSFSFFFLLNLLFNVEIKFHDSTRSGASMWSFSSEVL